MKCRHCDFGCGIYETRPPVCREFYCAWRREDFIPNSWRPDRSGIFSELELVNAPPIFPGVTGIALTLTGDAPEILRREDFRSFVTGAMRRGLPVILGLPGPPGFQGVKVLLNTGPVMEALNRNDLVKFHLLLEEALARLQAHHFKPYVLHYSGNETSVPPA
jgi:hypothetical protein